MNIEEATIRAFISPQKRERLVALLAQPKKRQKVLDLLHHLNDLDPRFASQIPPALQSPQAIFDTLISKGSPRRCHLISSIADLDATEVELFSALEGTVGFGMGSLLCCLPGKLAYYEGEDPNERYILQR